MKKEIDIKVRVKKIISILKKKYPQARCDLSCDTSWELLVSTMLSAQSTDKSVIEVTEKLFKKYPDARDFSRLTQGQLEKDIKRIGLARSKSKNIIAVSKIISNDYLGEVPDSIEELIKLPGVGRKTANVVLGNFYNIPSIAVDTHVRRVSYRLGLTKEGDAKKIEFNLQKLLPPKDWTVFAHLIIRLGRDTCRARRVDCQTCKISSLCPKIL